MTITFVVAVVAALAAMFFLGRQQAKPGAVATHTYHQLTFRRGMVRLSRFAPDGQTILYKINIDDEEYTQSHSSASRHH
jgi:hypothetical protein